MRLVELIVEKQLSDLEQYRRQVVKTLTNKQQEIFNMAQQSLSPLQVVTVKPIGSILDHSRFTEESDVDIGIWVKAPGPKGVSEELSWRAQHSFEAMPLDDIGVLNTVVFVT